MVKKVLTIPEAGIVITLVLLVFLFWLIEPKFMSVGNIMGMLRALPYTGIIAIGLALCLISGTIDISVGATAGLSSVVFSKLVVHDWSMPAAMALSVAVGLLAGYTNSVAIVRLGVSPFITTISTLYIFRGLGTMISSGYSVYPLPEEVTRFGALQPLGINWPFLIMLAIMVVVAALLTRTVWGMCIRATGSDIDVAKCNEVDVVVIQTSTLVICGGLAALAGVFITCILGAGQATAGTGYELIAITGCAIGGISLFGYHGSMIGLFLGLLTVQIISNGMIVVGVPPYMQSVVVGGILLVSMIVDVRRRTLLNIEQK